MYSFHKTEQKKIMPPLYDAMIVPDVLNKNLIQELFDIENKLRFDDAKVGADHQSNLDNTIRRSKVAWIYPDICPNNLGNQILESFKKINEEIYKFDLLGTESWQYTVYDQTNSGTYNWHIDTNRIDENNIRKLSVSILLSDPNEFEGGKLLLNLQGNIIVAEERQGRAIFFPSWIPHCVTPVTKGTRKSLVIWAHGPMFK